MKQLIDTLEYLVPAIGVILLITKLDLQELLLQQPPTLSIIVVSFSVLLFLVVIKYVREIDNMWRSKTAILAAFTLVFSSMFIENLLLTGTVALIGVVVGLSTVYSHYRIFSHVVEKDLEDVVLKYQPERFHRKEELIRKVSQWEEDIVGKIPPLLEKEILKYKGPIEVKALRKDLKVPLRNLLSALARLEKDGLCLVYWDGEKTMYRRREE